MCLVAATATVTFTIGTVALAPSTASALLLIRTSTVTALLLRKLTPLMTARFLGKGNLILPFPLLHTVRITVAFAFITAKCHYVLTAVF